MAAVATDVNFLKHNESGSSDPAVLLASAQAELRALCTDVLAPLESELAASEAELLTAETALEEERARAAALDVAAQEAQALVASLRADLGRTQALLDAAEQQARSAQDEALVAHEEYQELMERHRTMVDQSAQVRDSLLVERQRAARADEQLARVTELAESLKAQLSVEREQTSQTKSALAGATATIADLQCQLDELRAALTKAHAQSPDHPHTPTAGVRNLSDELNTERAHAAVLSTAVQVYSGQIKSLERELALLRSSKEDDLNRVATAAATPVLPIPDRAGASVLSQKQTHSGRSAATSTPRERERLVSATSGSSRSGSLEARRRDGPAHAHTHAATVVRAIPARPNSVGRGLTFHSSSSSHPHPHQHHTGNGMRTPPAVPRARTASNGSSSRSNSSRGGEAHHRRRASGDGAPAAGASRRRHNVPPAFRHTLSSVRRGHPVWSASCTPLLLAASREVEPDHDPDANPYERLRLLRQYILNSGAVPLQTQPANVDGGHRMGSSHSRSKLPIVAPKPKMVH